MQKQNLIILSALILPALVLTAPAQRAVPAADPAAAPVQTTKPAAPAADPFTRGDQRPGSSVAGEKQESETVNLLITLETWALKQADAVALMEAPDSHSKGYSHLQALVETGKARLVGFTAVPTKSGQRAVTESLDEVRYPVEFDRPLRAEDIASPTGWDTRNAGDVLEVEAVGLPNDPDRISLTIAPNSVRLRGFQDMIGDPAGVPIPQPQFAERIVRTSAKLTNGEPTILSISPPMPAENGAAGGDEMHLQTVRIVSQAGPRARADANAVSVAATVEFLVYKLERSAAARILRESRDLVSGYAQLRELMQRGEAELESYRAFLSHSGQRTVHEATTDFRFVSEVNSPVYSTENNPAGMVVPASPKSLETRKVGTIVEIEAAIDRERRLVEINVVPLMSSYLGLLQVGGIGVRYPAQPLFSSRKISTSVTGGLGQAMFIGTMSQPRDNGVNGRKDDGKTSLAFIRVMPLTP